MAKLVPGSPNFFQDHLRVYLETKGFEGHFLDISAVGGAGPTTMLLLKTIGRKSGKPLIVPLIYDNAASEYVIIASKGGAPVDPAWYFNLTASPNVEFQVADKCFRGTWRQAAGAERQRLWDQLVKYYPPYADYQKKTDREIPVVVLKADANIPSL